MRRPRDDGVPGGMAMHLLLLNAGGTISAQAGADGVLHGGLGTVSLAYNLGDRFGAVRELSVYQGLSEDMGFADLLSLLDALRAAAADPQVRGVVVAHGTDTLEESAFVADLALAGDMPVVFTGAQRAPGAWGFDGEINLADALTVARSEAARGLGVVVVFAGRVLAARRARKRRTTAPDAFTAEGGELGRVAAGRLHIFARPIRAPALDIRSLDPTVEIVTAGLGVSGRLLDALVDGGAQGLVLQALGRGNVGRDMVEAAGRAVARGCAVVVVSRSDEGGTAPDYEAGRRLADRGAHFCALDAAKARLALAALLASGVHLAVLGEALNAYGFT